MPRSVAAVGAACSLFYLTLLAAQPRPHAVPDPYSPLVAGLKARCIGPANTSGRVTDLAVVEGRPNTFYVATAGGGVWKTTDGGATLAPVFDDQPTLCVGAVAVCQGKPEVVYVGTGEANPRNSVSRGCGVFRSADGGRTWTHCGLAETHHIGRVVVHPRDPDVAYVAALGHCWGPNKSRGLFKTADGGKTWENVKFVDESTGFVDACMDPADPDTLYAAAWHVRRDAFSGGNPRPQTGPGGGLYKTTDGGKTWARLAGGLPEQADHGRCGVCVCRKKPNVVYAVVATSETVMPPGAIGQAATPTGKDRVPAPVGRVEAGGVFRSDDRGATWKKVNDLVPRPFYFGQIRVDPTDDQRLYVLGVTLSVSSNGGRTFTTAAQTIHPDHHALWVDPANPDHMVIGNDGGMYVSHDRGRIWEPKRGLVAAQVYGVAADARTPYRVYCGLQDGGCWGGPVATPFPDGVTLADWRPLLPGDGFQAAADPSDPDTVYLESQYGGLNRVTLGGPRGPVPKFIRPVAPKGTAPYRFNWNAPVVLSPHDPKTLYFGGQYLFKSADRGDTWEKISPDLTDAPKDARSLPFAHTIQSAAESPAKRGVLWVGTDDGKVWVSRNGGKDWADVGGKIPGVPRARAVSKIECSHSDPGAAFLAIDRHRNDDFKPYLFLTTDYGETWKSVAGDLPDGAVIGVVRQSSRAKDLLFAGTDTGLFVSFDGGTRWHHADHTGLPKGVRVDDLLIHPRERELVIGTHGRGVWVMDVAPLEQLGDRVLSADAHLFEVKPVALQKPRTRVFPVPPGFKAPNPPAGPVFAFLLNGPGPERVKFTWTRADGKTGGAESPVLGPGLHYRSAADLKADFEPGSYTVTLEARGVKVSQKFEVKAADADKKGNG